MAARNYNRSLNGHSGCRTARRPTRGSYQSLYRDSYRGSYRKLDYATVRSNAEELSERTIRKFNSIPEIKNLREGTVVGVSSRNYTLKDKIICSIGLGSFMVASILSMFVAL